MIVDTGAGCPLEMVFVLGYFLGIIFVTFGAYLLIYAYKLNLRNYYNYCDDSNKKEIMDMLKNIEIQYDFLQKKTNTNYFKQNHNRLVDLLAFMNKRNTQ